ncbi:MAG: putative ABC-type transport system, permease component [Myxococcales bacterium]|nr:putative ABC-type transport system, permease component [Myxococcales bacterium]
MEVELARQTIVADPPRKLRLNELLDELGACADQPAPDRPELTIGALVDKAAEAGFGFLIAIMVLIAIPFFGLSTPFGLAIALMGLQMMAGRTRPWLPQRARKRVLSMPMLDKVAGLLARRTRWLVKATRRRWEPLIRPRLIGIGMFLLAVGLALPLPIPGSNWIFLFPLFIYCVGLLERDGLWIVIGHLATIANITLMIVFIDLVMSVLARVWGWLT